MVGERRWFLLQPTIIFDVIIYCRTVFMWLWWELLQLCQILTRCVFNLDISRWNAEFEILHHTSTTSIIDLETRRIHFVSRLGGKMNKDRNNLVKWKRRMRCQYLISSNLVLNTYDYDLILSAWTNKFFALNLSFRILFIRELNC